MIPRKKYELNLLHCNSPHDNHLCLRQCVEASEDKTEAEIRQDILKKRQQQMNKMLNIRKW